MLLTERKDDLLCGNVNVSESGELLFAGMSTTELAKKYKTPLYLIDEDRIRERCRTYLSAVKDFLGDKGHVLYASKALSFKRIYEIMKSEEMGIDVVSSGEIATAVKAGFPLERAFFHSNNKTDEDVSFAMEKGVGYFVVDNAEELYAIDEEAKRRSITQKILLRITPGIDPHTYDEVATGKVDSKFGSAIETGQAESITALALSFENISLCGFHCHVGSLVFDSSVYVKTVDTMLGFISDMKKKLGFSASVLDLGGGFGVRYIPEHPVIDIRKEIESVAKRLVEKSAELGIGMPDIYFEPGRSIVADAGMTLYTVGTVKRIPGYKNYVSVDGGMTDSPRYILYGARYTVLPADNMYSERDMECSLVGRCCESGDIIAEGITLPSDIKRGDTVAVLTTGVYHYSMASNYNRIPRPPVVMISDESSYIAVRRETFDDITSCDI
ncbi:MAG: diaminopimelate decarboxylase [Clostridia bacterium]|nr:diaminopimelate decarboxylase [Clostridia bacterium]